MTGLLTLKLVSGPVRWLVYPATAAGVALMMVVTPQPGATAAPADPAGWAALPTEKELSAEAHALHRQHTVVANRLAFKDALVTDLVDGRATLAAVAEAFLRLNQASPAGLAVLRDAYPGRTDFERAAHNVIEFARSRPMADAVRAAVMARLAAELAAVTASPAGPPGGA